MYVVWYFSHEREKLTPVPINHSHSISISTATLGTTHGKYIYKWFENNFTFSPPHKTISRDNLFLFSHIRDVFKKDYVHFIAVGGGTLKVERFQIKELETHGSIYPCLHRDRLWS